MTVEDYKNKYQGKSKNPKIAQEIMKDFSSDFFNALRYVKGDKRITMFKNCLKVSEKKWEQIAALISWSNTSFWRAFLEKTALIKFRELFPSSSIEWIQNLIKIQQRRENWANQQHYQQYQQRENYNSFKKPVFPILSQDYKLLGLPPSATIDEVKRRFRALALINHPDKGGKHEDFIKITAAKDRILNNKK